LGCYVRKGDDDLLLLQKNSFPDLASAWCTQCPYKSRFNLECERLASEVARQKPYIRDLERAAAAARTAQRQSDEAAALLQRQLGQMRQAQQQEVEALAAELSKARHSVR
jgi:DNA anti-recombination protein RmuC